MEIKNNKEEIPLAHYLEEFAKINPSQRAEDLELDYTNSTFLVKMYGVEYSITWPNGNISCNDPTAIGVNSAAAHILLLRYLINGKKLPSMGQFKTFRELPWGEVYIKPFTGRCLTRLAYKYDGKKELFVEAAKLLGGKTVNHSDAGLEFNFIGDYNIIFLLWGADEEFPPSAQIEFSDNFAAGFSAEDNVVVAELLITAISNKMKEIG